jgi:hypothetical protein
MPQIALLDIDLRDGDSGVDVARALLERWGVPSIFISGQAVEARAGVGHRARPPRQAIPPGNGAWLRRGGARGDGRREARSRAQGFELFSKSAG